MNELLNDIDRVYKGIQNLNVQPTKTNTAIILDALQVMEAVYAYIRDNAKDEPEKEEEDANGNDQRDDV